MLHFIQISCEQEKRSQRNRRVKQVLLQHFITNFPISRDVWREDSSVLTNKTHLPVKQLTFGDTDIDQDGVDEKGHHTLGKFKFKCSGIA